MRSMNTNVFLVLNFRGNIMPRIEKPFKMSHSVSVRRSLCPESRFGLTPPKLPRIPSDLRSWSARKLVSCTGCWCSRAKQHVFEEVPTLLAFKM
mmetsp:Transcript_16809/g.23028  ORF Transcript_16809/g.23028 Transcript_16809/m.23028 type:complete len:94 (+) Transcript_16809:874-1155(+)